MKIIDFEHYGNVIRLYFGADDCNDYWGDDWNDAPYEHNAGQVYQEFIKGYDKISKQIEEFGGFKFLQKTIER